MSDFTRGSDFAFPHAIKSPSGEMLLNAGLTKREYFAAIALQGFVSTKSVYVIAEAVKWSVAAADALIEQLNADV